MLDEAFAIATRAAELDSHDSRCQHALGFIWLYRREYEVAERHYRRALELNPNDSDRMFGMGIILNMRGRPDEGLGWMEAAMRLNPFYPIWYELQFGIVLYSLRRYDEAVKALKRRPNATYWATRSRARLAACYAQLGQTEQAEKETAEVLRMRSDFSTEHFLRHEVLLEQADDIEHLREGLIKAGLPP